MNHKLTLYYFNSCPFCQDVLQFIKQKNITVSLANIHTDPNHKADLIRVGGKQQVPCLIIDGNPLYESRDIIDWLHTNAG